MYHRHYVSELVESTKEKKRYFLLIAGLVLILLIETLFLVFNQKQERTIVVPMQLSQSFWVDEQSVSASYITEMARFIAGSVLTVTPESIKAQETALLRFTHPSHRGQLQQHWQQWLTRIEAEKVSHVFIPHAIEVQPKSLTALVTGELLTFIGEDKLAQIETTYQLTFVYENGRLWLSQMDSIEKTMTKKGV
jgi:conjugal transfer pilus assembly protein TraE